MSVCLVEIPAADMAALAPVVRRQDIAAMVIWNMYTEQGWEPDRNLASNLANFAALAGLPQSLRSVRPEWAGKREMLGENLNPTLRQCRQIVEAWRRLDPINGNPPKLRLVYLDNEEPDPFRSQILAGLVAPLTECAEMVCNFESVTGHPSIPCKPSWGDTYERTPAVYNSCISAYLDGQPGDEWTQFIRVINAIRSACKVGKPVVMLPCRGNRERPMSPELCRAYTRAVVEHAGRCGVERFVWASYETKGDIGAMADVIQEAMLFVTSGFYRPAPVSASARQVTTAGYTTRRSTLADLERATEGTA